MGGLPVWLVSVSFAPGGRVRATGSWSSEELAIAESIALRALKGVGDPEKQRAFRMNITFCIHRATTAAERQRLPAERASAPGGLAGGPVEVLWSRGIEHRLAAMPCELPTRRVVDQSRPDLWFPEDCGSCASCIARLACR